MGKHITRALCFLLPAALQNRFDLRLIFYIQKTTSLRTMNLMPADGKQINMHFPRKNPHFPIRLNSVYMKQGSGIYFLNDPARLFNGFHRTNFIIHLHKRYQDGVRPDCRPKIVQRNDSLPIYRKNRHLITMFFEPPHGIRHGGVFNAGSNHMHAAPLVGLCSSDNCKVIGLRASGGEDDLLLLALECLCNLLCRIFYIVFRHNALLMHGGRISVILRQKLHHQICGLPAASCRGRIIQICFHNLSLVSCP